MSLYLGSTRVAPTVRVADANIESITITPSTTSQTIASSASIDGYAPVVVSAVTAAIDSNLKAENIKAGVTILGVIGTYTGS